MIKEDNKEKGSVIIIVAVFLSVAVLILSIAIDLGLAYAKKARLQDAVDMAAMSVSYYLPTDDCGGCEALAVEMLSRNGFPDGTVTATFSWAPEEDGKYGTVIISAEGESARIFSGSGNSPFNLKATATADKKYSNIETIPGGSE